MTVQLKPPRRSLLRVALLLGASASAIAINQPAWADGPRTFSPAWFAARAAAARSTAGASASAASAASLRNVGQSLANMGRAAAGIRSAAQLQAQARLRGNMASVPDGLLSGGLVADAGWRNALAPVQTGATDQPTVTVKQTAQQAILNWRSFNVGARTTLAFDQSAGGANAAGWVAVNRVTDPSANPSQILGSITAPGKVFILNRNGIIFGRTSQVSVGALLAAAADVSDTQLTANGIYSGTDSNGVVVPSITGASAKAGILVEQGAQIRTAAATSVLTGGGSVILLGGSVRNDGQIETPAGQTVLAAGQDFILKQGYSVTQNADGTLSGNRTSTTLGTEVMVAAGVGSVSNSGLIMATTGDVSLVGRHVAQNGVVVSTTSVNQRGTVHLLTDTGPDDDPGSVTLGADSLTTVQIDGSAATAFNSRRNGLIDQSNASATLPGANPLSDRLDQSRIEITTGGLAEFAGGSLTMAQGGRVAISAGRRVFIGAGAAIDTSGVVGVTLPASANAVVVNIQGFEQRDAPVNRDAGRLNSSNVTLNVNDLVLIAAGAGGYPDDRYYTRGGLLEVGGYLGTSQHGIAEWASVGGTIQIASPQVIAQPTSVLNVAGGSINYQAGKIGVSYLIGRDGHLYNASTAPADLLYTGVYGGQTLDHPRWGVTETYRSVLIAPAQRFQTAYTVGRDGGEILIQATTAILDGELSGGVVTGPRQVAARPSNVTDSYSVPQSAAPLGGQLKISNPNNLGLEQQPLAIDVRIADSDASLAGILTAADEVPAARLNTAWLTPRQISDSGLASLTIVTAGKVAVLNTASFTPGGTISIIAPVVDLAGSIIARAGSVVVRDGLTSQALDGGPQQLQLDGKAGVTLHAGASIDVRGLWVNALADPTEDRAGTGFINGGSVSLISAQSVVLAAGSTIDVSAGAALSPTGVASGGMAGSLTLQADTPNLGAISNRVIPLPEGVTATPIGTVEPVVALTLDGALRGFAVTTGGTLSIGAPSIRVGASAETPHEGTLLLTPAIAQLGFRTVILNGHLGLTVTDGTTLAAAAPTYQLALVDRSVPTGRDPSDALPLMLPPLYTFDTQRARIGQRVGTSLVLQSAIPTQDGTLGGPISIGRGAVISVDALQSVRLETTNAQLTVLGTISAPGGAISLLQNARVKSDATVSASPFPDRGLSVWLGEASRLDVAGRAVSALDTQGRTYSTTVAANGGSVTIGGSGTLPTDATTTIALPAAAAGFVAIRPGAVIDASAGAVIVDELAGLEPRCNKLRPGQQQSLVLFAGNGGTIVIASAVGAALDGALVAAGGGPQAAGGTLGVALQTPVIYIPTATSDATPPTIDPALLVPRNLTLSQTATSALAGLVLAPGEAIPAAAIGQLRITPGLVAAGGFDSLALATSDALIFDGPVSLRIGRKLEVSASALVQTTKGATVDLSAPYVLLGAGPRGVVPLYNPLDAVIGRDFLYSGIVQNATQYAGGVVASETMAGTLSVSADFLRGNLQLGITGIAYGPDAEPTTINAPSFSTTRLFSTGDVRPGNVQTAGDLTVIAAQIVPLDRSVRGTLAAGGVLRIGRSTDTIPAPPLEIGGALELQAPTIEQGGIVRAPFGNLVFSGPGGGASVADIIEFLPGSITSVSAGGVSTLFGGTTDGVNYRVAGALLTPEQGATTSGRPLNQPVITVTGRSVSVGEQATLDLSGGGNIQGAGFITGRGGSTDTLLSPVLRFNPTSAAAPTSGNVVYAIVADAQPGLGAAPPVTQAENYGGALPLLGQQIVLDHDAAGLKAGTYTLLPAYYALLPGGYRVEVGSSRVTSAGALAFADGSVITSAYTTIANTSVRSAMPVQVTLISGGGARARSTFDEQSPTDFVLAQSRLFGQTRGGIPADGGLLLFQYSGRPVTDPVSGDPTVGQAADRPAFSFAGKALFQPGPNGIGGAAAFDGVFFSGDPQPEFEVVASGATSTPGFLTLDARDLSALGAPRLSIGGFLANGNTPTAGQIGGPANVFQSNGAVGVTVRNGATLSAGEVLLIGNVTLESGSVVNTIGAGPAAYDSTNVDAYVQGAANAVVAVSNGYLRFQPAQRGGSISIETGATLLTEGSIGLVTTGALDLPQGVRFGARYISFSTSSANIGSAAALGALGAAGALPTGLDLSAEVLATLLRGDPTVGAPALQRLTLTAAKSVNFLGGVTLDTTNGGATESTLDQFVLNTPAIYGSGVAGDTAVVSVGTLYWNGIEDKASVPSRSLLPGGPTAGGPGTGGGALDIRANRVVFGYAPDDQPNNQITLDRVTFGFDTVKFTARDRIEGNNLGSLAVYRQQDGIGFTGIGGTLSLAAPLLTGDSGSLLSLTAGGAIVLSRPTGAAAYAGLPATLGAEIHLTSPSVSIDTAVVLPSGRLVTTASGDIAVGAGARLDVAGHEKTFFDQMRAGPGGTIALESSGGSIRVDPAAAIDISAVGANAGSVVATAASGAVDLGGAIAGGATTGFDGGTVAIRAGVLPDFTALNTRLNAGGITGARSFDIKTGDVTVADVIGADGSATPLLNARTISVSVDGGVLTVDGRVNASGARPGSIRLAGARGLTLTARAVLDAHSTAAQVDSYGAPIDAENRASVVLTAGGPATGPAGTLSIAPSVVIDVSAAPGVSCLLGTAACGTVELNAPRIGDGDIAIFVPGAITVSGARSIAVNATTHVAPPSGTIVQANLAANGNPIDPNLIGLDQIDAANTRFIDAALPGGGLNVTLASKLAGLAGPYADAFHLRPGVEIDSPPASALNPEGALCIPGDLDLSGLRYASLNPATQKTAAYGSGEPGTLTLRAAGSLVVNGSVTDGFAPPADPTNARGATVNNPSGNGWLLYRATTGSIAGQDPFGGDVVLPYSLPAPVQLRAGTSLLATEVVLGYDIPLVEAAIRVGRILPQDVVLAAPVTLLAETVATARITAPGGTIIEKGQIIPAGTTIDAGATLGAGSLFATNAVQGDGTMRIAAGVWRAGGSLGLFAEPVTLSATATLGGGSLIPSGATLVLGRGTVNTRAPVTGGVQGRIWGAAPLLPAGSESWSLRLVSGADLAAADSRTLLPKSALGDGGTTVLADTHYTVTFGRRNSIVGINPSFSVIRTGTGDLDLLSGGSFTESSLWGIYTAGTPSPDLGRTISGGVDTLDQGRNEFNLVRGVTDGSVLGRNGGVYETLVNAASGYTAWYPQGGGDVLLAAQGDITGDIHDGAAAINSDLATESNAVVNYLWRQGGGTAVDQPTAWWINYGTYVTRNDVRNSAYPDLIGFIGVGTLGGGNVTVASGGDVGPVTDRGSGGQTFRSSGLDVTVAGSGRVVDGQVVQTGGGRLSITAGGAVNPTSYLRDDEYGTWTNLRGDIDVNAGSVGQVTLNFNTNASDPRRQTNVAELAAGSGGPVLVLGDSVAVLNSRRDLVLSGVGDPTRLVLSLSGEDGQAQTWNTTPFTYQTAGTSAFSEDKGNTFFSLWQPGTAIKLQSSGGNVTPFTVNTSSTGGNSVNDAPISGSAYYLPGSLSVTAIAGSVYNAPQIPSDTPIPFELAPSPIGQLEFFAGDSIYNLSNGAQATARAYNMSGASIEAVASIARPAFNNASPSLAGGTITNADPNGVPSPLLFAFTDRDTANGTLHAADLEPIRFYALGGDIVGLQVGQRLTPPSTVAGAPILYRAAKPVQVRAGRDVVRPGVGADVVVSSPDTADFQAYSASGSFILNIRPTDVSVFSAGRDIIYANLQVAGPGSLLVQAGRNVYQGNQGVLESIGTVINPDPQSRSGGASILTLVGVGAAGPDWTTLGTRYLDPDNKLVSGTPLGDGANATRVAKTYDAELLDWLRENYAYAGTVADALATFQALPVEQQATFLAPIYFSELRLSGREYNDPASVRNRSYARGRAAIATLFPGDGYDGALTLFSGTTTRRTPIGTELNTIITDGGIRTDRGGAVVVLDPGGGVTVGVTGIAPGSDAGLLTQGSGDVDIFSRGSVLLGQSRVFTTFGGGITIWAAQGDINAGRGSKTTVVSAPQQILYDDFATVLLSPTVPTTGAGIATLNPIPEVAAGDVDLIAPLGVIDAGEAGIRVSGNANLAALTIVNAANIQVQGKTTGVPVVAVPNLGALTAAQAAAGGAEQAALATAQKQRKSSDSIITVEVLGFGP